VRAAPGTGHDGGYRARLIRCVAYQWHWREVELPRTEPPARSSQARLSPAAWRDNTGEALAGMLRRGAAGSGTAADHLTVLEEAIGRSRPATVGG
jgi:hypothetical protein